MLRRRMFASRLSVATLVGALLSIASLGARESADHVLRASVDVSTVNPCTGEGVSGPLDVVLVVNTVLTGSGRSHINIHGSFHGQLAGTLGTTFQISAEGNEQFDSAADHYDAAFSVNAIGRGTEPNLTLDGVARVFVDANGNPLSAHILNITANCL